MEAILTRLLHIAQTKQEKFIEILDKTIEQQSSIFEDNFERLIMLTGFKQNLINDIDLLNIEFNELSQQLGKNKQKENKDGNYIELRKKTEDIVILMVKINELECKNKVDLTNKMDESRQHIKQLKVGKKGFNAYYQSCIQNSNYIDQKN